MIIIYIIICLTSTFYGKTFMKRKTIAYIKLTKKEISSIPGYNKRELVGGERLTVQGL